MNAVKTELPALVKAELAAANRDYPQFHSMHEGYAVLLEEIEEAASAQSEMDACKEMMWAHIKHDSPKAFEYAQRIERYATHLAAEAIQVAAMAQKFQNIRRK